MTSPVALTSTKPESEEPSPFRRIPAPPGERHRARRGRRIDCRQALGLDGHRFGGAPYVGGGCGGRCVGGDGHFFRSSLRPAPCRFGTPIRSRQRRGISGIHASDPTREHRRRACSPISLARDLPSAAHCDQFGYMDCGWWSCDRKSSRSHADLRRPPDRLHSHRRGPGTLPHGCGAKWGGSYRTRADTRDRMEARGSDSGPYYRWLHDCGRLACRRDCISPTAGS